MLESLVQDVRFATRSLRKTPGFTLIAISSLALGIGANTAIFSFVNAILLKHLPVPDPARLVQLGEFSHNKELNTSFSYPFIDELNKSRNVFDGVAGRFPVRVNLTSGGTAEPLNGELVTGVYFKTLEVHAALGRLLDENDVRAASASPVCVISYSLWQSRFGSDPRILGRKISLNSRPYSVIGVTEPAFRGAQLQSEIDMQLPVSRMSDFMGGFSTLGGQAAWKSPGFTWLEPLARLRPNLTRAKAEAMLQSVARELRIQLSFANDRAQLAGEKRTYRLLDGSQGVNHVRSTFARPLTVLMGVVALVLLVACANLANLLLARASARKKEFAIRLSLGASRGRVIRQLMAENLSIGLSGGLAGLLLSYWIIDTLLAFLNSGRPAGSLLRAAPDPLVICFCVGLSLVTAVLFGLAPAWQSVRPDVVPELKDSSAARGVQHSTSLRKSLIVLQFALSLVIVFAAGLLTRTLSRLQTVDLGFKPDKVIALSVNPSMSGYSRDDSDRIFDSILSRVRSLPGITAASLATVTPLEGSMIALPVDVPGHVKRQSDMQTGFNAVSPDYFAALDQPLLMGRDFSDRDVEKAPHVAVVNQFFVSQYMPGLNPIGRHFSVGGGDVQITGVVKNAHYQSIRESTRPIVYVPAKQAQTTGFTLLIRTTADPRATIPSIERAIHGIDSRLPIYGVRTLQAQIDQGISSERVLSFLSTLFSALATLLCCIGLYGIVAYAVSRRTREIGVRLAIGAQKSDVAALFLRESAVIVASGIVLGVPAALVATRLLKSLLYGLQPTDAPTLVVSSAVLLLAGFFATVLPVRRAAAIEPLQALRHE